MARFTSSSSSFVKFAKNLAKSALSLLCLRASPSSPATAEDQYEAVMMKYQAPPFGHKELKNMLDILAVGSDVYKFRSCILRAGLDHLCRSFDPVTLLEERIWPRWVQLELLLRSEEVARQKWQREQSPKGSLGDGIRSVRRQPATPTHDLLHRISANNGTKAEDIRREVREYCFLISKLEAVSLTNLRATAREGCPDGLLEYISSITAYLNRPFKRRNRKFPFISQGDEAVRAFCEELARDLD